MTVAQEPAPSPGDLLARWRERYRTQDYDALVDLYDDESVFLGGTPDVRIGRSEIAQYFDALRPLTGLDVEFDPVTSRLLRPGVLLVAAFATFTGVGRSLKMRLTHVWVEGDRGWLIAHHHASPLSDIKTAFVQG